MQVPDAELDYMQLDAQRLKAKTIAQQTAKKECYEELLRQGLPIPWDLHEEMTGWGNTKCDS